jgi:hypothetical protein
MKIHRNIIIVLILQWTVLVCFFVDNNLTKRELSKRPTYKEVIIFTEYITDSIVQADSQMLFEKKVNGNLKSLLYLLVDIQRGKAYSWELNKYIYSLAKLEESRSIKARKEFLKRIRLQYINNIRSK